MLYKYSERGTGPAGISERRVEFSVQRQVKTGKERAETRPQGSVNEALRHTDGFDETNGEVALAPKKIHSGRDPRLLGRRHRERGIGGPGRLAQAPDRLHG